MEALSTGDVQNSEAASQCSHHAIAHRVRCRVSLRYNWRRDHGTVVHLVVNDADQLVGCFVSWSNCLSKPWPTHLHSHDNQSHTRSIHSFTDATCATTCAVRLSVRHALVVCKTAKRIVEILSQLDTQWAISSPNIDRLSVTFRRQLK